MARCSVKRQLRLLLDFILGHIISELPRGLRAEGPKWLIFKIILFVISLVSDTNINQLDPSDPRLRRFSSHREVYAP